MPKQVRSPNPNPEEHLRSSEDQVRSIEDQVRSIEDQEMSPEEQQECDRMAAAIIADDPHAVLVEFSSVVADTQEYIIGVSLLDTFTFLNVLKYLVNRCLTVRGHVAYFCPSTIVHTWGKHRNA